MDDKNQVEETTATSVSSATASVRLFNLLQMFYTFMFCFTLMFIVGEAWKKALSGIFSVFM